MRTAILLLALASSALAGTFTATWGPVQPSGAQWVTVTHVATGRNFQLKAALCVRREWLVAPDPAAARNQWLTREATAYITRLLYSESAEGIREATIARLKAAAQQALQAQAECETIRAALVAAGLTTLAARVPKITVDLGK